MIKKHFYLETHYGARAYTKKSKLVRAIFNSKHHQNKDDFEYVADRMARKIPVGMDCVTSVPRRDSSSNYSLRLAKRISEKTGIPYQPAKKVKEGSRVLIVDDVVETGRTVRNTAKKLKSAKEVSVLTATKGLYFRGFKRG